MPKFIVNSLSNGKEVSFVYNTDDNSIRNTDGEDLLALYKARQEYPITKDFNRKYNPYKKSCVTDLLEISLGFNCNFKCEYCSQNLLKNKAYSGTPKDALTLIELLKEKQIKATNIQLWGGEPFVYWKTILVLLPRLRELYPKAFISIATNGSLLTKDKVDFLLKYECSLCLSHDGAGNEFRHKDVLKQPELVDVLKYAINTMGKHFSINATPARGNTDVIKIAKFFNEFFDIKDNSLIIGAHNIVRCHDSRDLNQVEACKIPEKDLEVYTDSIFRALNSVGDEKYKFDSLEYKVQRAIEGILTEEPIESVLAECFLPFSNGLLIDMKGNVLPCHNHAIQENSCGNLSQLEQVKPLGYNCWRNKPRCRECPYIHWCKGGCPSADDRANELACRNLQALYLAILKTVFARLFGVYVTSIEKEQK